MGGQEITQEENRLDGYLISDINECLTGIDGDMVERFRHAKTKPYFNQLSGIGGGLWFAKWGMVEISLGLLAANMLIVCLIMAIYARIHQGNATLNHLGFSNCVYIVIAVVLILEIYPLGRLGDRLLWRRIKEILDDFDCKDRPEVENKDLKHRLAESGKPSNTLLQVMLGMNIICAYLCQQITTLLFLYYGYKR